MTPTTSQSITVNVKRGSLAKTVKVIIVIQVTFLPFLSICFSMCNNYHACLTNGCFHVNNQCETEENGSSTDHPKFQFGVPFVGNRIHTHYD